MGHLHERQTVSRQGEVSVTAKREGEATSCRGGS